MFGTSVLPLKERLIVQQLRDFIDKDEENTIALVSGMRKVGKTTALKQLERSYGSRAVYADLSVDADGFEDMLDDFLDSPATILLLDEIAYLQNYELTSQSLYDLSNSSERKNFKVILTGSSAAHLTRLADTKLGGRAKLYRLPVITFVEYLYFTGRIPDYHNFMGLNTVDFADYLQLKGLEELTVQFDDRYFDAYYREVEIGNRRRGLSYSMVDLKSGDLQSMARLIAHKLSEPKVYTETISPEVGNQERSNLRNLIPRVRFAQGIDLSDAVVAESARQVKNVTTKDKGRILSFMLTSTKLAHVDIGEVDVCDYHKELLMELTVGKKGAGDVKVHGYFAEQPFIRVCATRSKSFFDGEYHRIFYPILACMLDMDDIYSLPPSLRWTDEQRVEYGRNYGKPIPPADITNDIVLAFVNNKDGRRVGLRVWKHALQKDGIISIPSDLRTWNLDIVHNKLVPKFCNLGDFPVQIVDNMVTPVEHCNITQSGGWVIGRYTNGSLRLMSYNGKIKNVTQEAAITFYKQHHLSNADIDEEKGMLVGRLGRWFDRID